MDRRYKASEEITLRYYQMPKALFKNDQYKGLSLAAKATYSILRDRQDLSIKNNWVDEEGYIFFIFSEKELGSLIETTEKTARGYKKELIKYDLLMDKRMGRGMPNRLYVLKVELSTNITLDTTKNGHFYRSRTVDSTGPERSFLPPNDTEYIETDKIKDNLYKPIIEPYNWLEPDKN